ncbi:MAG: MATE family efflux transporter, partial [Helicobacter sp.]|nr:MATE family efflux transporter [Helicobacter sp.]
VQPIASFNYGAKLLKRVRQIFYFGLGFSFIIGIILYLAFYYFGSSIIPLFLQNDIAIRDTSLIVEIKNAMNIHFLGFVLLGINIVSAIFFQSIQRTLSSFIITFSYTLLFTLCFVLFLPKFYGFDGVIMAYPLGVLCASFITFGIIYYERKHGTFDKPKDDYRIHNIDEKAINDF